MLQTLRPIYPEWDIWYVPRLPVGETWHAKPKSVPLAVVHADTPEELISEIAELVKAAEQTRPGPKQEIELADETTPALPE